MLYIYCIHIFVLMCNSEVSQSGLLTWPPVWCVCVPLVLGSPKMGFTFAIIGMRRDHSLSTWTLHPPPIPLLSYLPALLHSHLFSISIILRTSSRTSLYPSPLPPFPECSITRYQSQRWTHPLWPTAFPQEYQPKTCCASICVSTMILINNCYICSCCRCEHTLQCRSVLFAEVVELALQVEKKDHLWYDTTALNCNCHWNWHVAVWSILWVYISNVQTCNYNELP